MSKKKTKLPSYQKEALVQNFEPKTKKQEEFIDLINSKEVIICKGTPGSGKSYVALARALDLLGDYYKQIVLVKSLTTVPEEEIGFLKGPQPLFSKISTPNGWVEMGDIKIGDNIHAYDGSVCKVTNLSKINNEDYYKITTKDNRYTFASTKHKWYLDRRSNKTGTLENGVFTTDEIIKTLDKYNYYLPLHKCVEYNNVELPMDPYLLGVLIGDGSISGTHTRFASADKDIVSKVTNIVENLGLKVKKQNKYSYTITSGRTSSGKGSRILARKNIITGEVEILGTLKEANFKLGYPTSKPIVLNRCTKNSTVDNWQYFFTGEVAKSPNLIKNALEDLNLLGKCAWEKHIPDLYLYSSKDDRIELLRGLLDTDGGIKPDGTDISYYTTSLLLRDNIIQLVQSLGGLAYYTTSNEVGDLNNVYNDCEIYSRRESYQVYIKFYTDDFNPFYLNRKAERFKPTSIHRYATKIKNIELVGKTDVRCLTINHPSKLYLTDSFIPTHNSVEEKMDPYIMNFTWNIDKLCGEGTAKSLIDKELIKILPIAFVRGITLDNSIVLLDEIQNLSYHTFKTLITRIGERSKYIMMGDAEQIDRRNKSESPLEKIFEIFKDHPLVGTLEFKDEDCIRNPIIPEILKKLREHGI